MEIRLSFTPFTHTVRHHIPAGTSLVILIGKVAVLIPGAVKDKNFKVWKVLKKFEGVGRIFHGIIKMHFIIIFQLKIKGTALDEIVAAVFVQAVKGKPLKTMLIKPLAGSIIGTYRPPCNDFYIVPSIQPFVNCLNRPGSFLVRQKNLRPMGVNHHPVVVLIGQRKRQLPAC